MTKTLLLLANGFENYEASVFTDVLGWNEIEGDGSTKLVSCGLTKTVTPTWGLPAVVDFLPAELNLSDYDALAIPGGFAEADFYDDAFNESFLKIIQYFDSREKIIAGICVATLPIAKSGVLKGRRATTYHYPGSLRRSQLAELGACVDDTKTMVEDRNIITSANPAAALDVAFRLLELLTDTKNMAKVKNLMGF